MWGSLSQGRDDPDRVRVLVENHELPVLLLLHDEPVLRREARLPEPDLLFPGRLSAVSHVRPPLRFPFCGRCGMLVLLNFLIYEYYIAYLRECQYIYEKNSRIFERCFLCLVNFYENYALKKELRK